MTEITEIRENSKERLRKNRMTKECITALVRWNLVFTFLKEKFLAQYRASIAPVLQQVLGLSKQNYLSFDGMEAMAWRRWHGGYRLRSADCDRRVCCTRRSKYQLRIGAIRLWRRASTTISEPGAITKAFLATPCTICWATASAVQV